MEDNPADSTLIREALAEYGVQCELIALQDGERALAFIRSLETGEARRPDLVILDLNLPRKSGLVVLENLRASTAWDNIPVIVLTSSNLPQDRDEAMRLGASLFLHKPSKLREFISLGRIFKQMVDHTPT